MDRALAAQGTPVQKANALLAAMRNHAGLPEGQKRAHLLTLATLAQSSKDAALAERVLAAGGQLLPQNVAESLVEMLFTGVDRVYLVGNRVQHLKLLPGERALELLRTCLRKFNAEERRTQQYRVLQSSGLQEEVMLGMAADLDLDRLGPTDQYQLNTLAARFEQMPASVRAVLLEKFEQKLPQDPSTLLIRMRDKPVGPARVAASLAALRDLASRRDLEARATTVIDALLQPLSTADAEGLLGSLTEKSPLQLRTALLRRVGRSREAADAMVLAMSKRPDDTSLLYSAARLLEADGMLEQAAELYRTARRKAATFYAHQAQQLARLELRLGNHQAALDALLEANDPLLSNFRLLLRVLTGVEDPARRQALLKQALQRRAPSARSGVASFVRLGGSVEREYKLAEALRAPALPSLLPKDAAAAEEAASDYDMLAFLPEGEEIARAVLRAMDGAARDGDLGVYRGMLGAAQRRGRADVLLREAEQRLLAEPNDAEALRVMLAAAQIGLKTPAGALRAAFLRRISEQRLDTATTVEMLALAQQAGDGEMADQILSVLLSQRANLMDMRLRPWLPGLLALACKRAPERVLALAPAVDGDLQVDVDGELLAAVASQHPQPAAAVAAFGPAVRQRFESAAEVYRDTLVTLPWSGLLLAAGDLEGALAALQRRPPTPIIADSVPPHVLAATVPPLERWAHPEQSGQLAAVLVAGAAEGEEERRALFVRLGAVLAARLEAAGKGEAAGELRGRLRTAAAGLPLRLGDWLGPG